MKKLFLDVITKLKILRRYKYFVALAAKDTGTQSVLLLLSLLLLLLLLRNIDQIFF